MTIAKTVSVEPDLSRLVASTNGAADQHLDNYGEVKHRIWWKGPIASASEAVIRDCQDQSHYGAVNTQTKKKITVGTARVNYKGELVKGPNGVWRVRTITQFTGDEC